MNKNRLYLSIASLIGLGMASSAFAATTTTGTMPVLATVVATCSVSAAPLIFGAIDLHSGVGAAKSTGALNVTCTNTTPYTVGLNSGASGNGKDVNRAMKNAAASGTINYGLFSDSLYAVPWGDGQAGNGKTKDGAGTGITETLLVFGKISSDVSAVAPGLYADSVTITITY